METDQPQRQHLIQLSPSSHLPSSTPVQVLVLSMAYSMKGMDKARKTDYKVHKLHGLVNLFISVEELKQAVEDTCDIDVALENMGYIEPGHRAKGKQRWLMRDADVSEMNRVHQGKKEILLWCYSVSPSKHGQSPSNDSSRKRGHSPSNDSSANQPPPKSSRYTNHLDKMTEVESIEEKLKEKHCKDGISEFSDEQLRSWAHLIQMGKHSSYEKPPDKPFWKNCRASSGSSSSGSTPASASPSKRIQLRGQCVEQLLCWHELLERGAITQTVFDEMQASIMTEDEESSGGSFCEVSMNSFVEPI